MFVPPGILDQTVAAGPNSLVLVQNPGQINVYSLGNCVTPPHPPHIITVGGSLQSLKRTERCHSRTKRVRLNTEHMRDEGLYKYILETEVP